MNGKVEIYATETGYDCPGITGIKLDHVWVSTEVGPHNWNCFGRGREKNHEKGTRLLGTATGNIDWMAAVYGTEAEGKEGRDDNPAAAGCVELYHGVCQNVANRILVMTEENADVSKAAANEIVVLTFGKYGFGVEAFIERLKSTAVVLNRVNPGSVSEDELKRTLENVRQGTTVKAEFDALTDGMPVIRAAILARTTEAQRQEFVKEYSAFQRRRADAFAAIDKDRLPHHDARGKMGEFLKHELGAFLEKLRAQIGPEAYDKALKVLPQNAWNLIQHIK